MLAIVLALGTSVAYGTSNLLGPLLNRRHPLARCCSSASSPRSSARCVLVLVSRRRRRRRRRRSLIGVARRAREHPRPRGASQGGAVRRRCRSSSAIGAARHRAAGRLRPGDRRRAHGAPGRRDRRRDRRRGRSPRRAASTRIVDRARASAVVAGRRRSGFGAVPHRAARGGRGRARRGRCSTRGSRSSCSCSPASSVLRAELSAPGRDLPLMTRARACCCSPGR